MKISKELAVLSAAACDENSVDYVEIKCTTYGAKQLLRSTTTLIQQRRGKQATR
jgi:hypothetical protein